MTFRAPPCMIVVGANEVTFGAVNRKFHDV
jgi:hypothetical protein